MKKCVYISSATQEMREYREAAIKAIEAAGMKPIYLNKGFDIPSDPNLTLLDLNERYVRSCDVFVGIYGYGGTWQPLLFSIGSEHQTDLDSENISAGLRQEFENSGFPLSQNATVLVQKQGIEWRIDDSDNKQMCIIRKEEREESKLDIYSKKLISEYEYEWARQYGLPCFCYVPGNQEPERLQYAGYNERMEEFRNDLVSRFPVSWLSNPEALSEHLLEHLKNLREKIFLSYSSKDQEFVTWMKDQLHKDNLSAWRDGDQIKPGAEWINELRIALDECMAMVLFISQNSIESEYVGLEVQEFLDKSKPIFPVLVSPCNLPGNLPRQILALQRIDATHNRDQAYFKLRRAIEDTLPSSMPSDEHRGL